MPSVIEQPGIQDLGGHASPHNGQQHVRDLAAHRGVLMIKGLKTILWPMAGLNARVIAVYTAMEFESESEGHGDTALAQVCDYTCIRVRDPVDRPGKTRPSLTFNLPGLRDLMKIRWMSTRTVFARQSLAVGPKICRGMNSGGGVCRTPIGPETRYCDLHSHQAARCKYQSQPSEVCNADVTLQQDELYAAPYCDHHLSHIEQIKASADTIFEEAKQKIEQLNTYCDQDGQGHLYETDMNFTRGYHGPCPICYEDMWTIDCENKVGYLLACGHRFHQNCLDELFIQKKEHDVREHRCPMCRCEQYKIKEVGLVEFIHQH